VRIGERKLCGILIESGYAGNGPVHAVVGIGLNVNLDVAAYPEIAALATSMAREAGHPISREHTLAALLNAFERHYACGDADSLRLAWRRRLDTLGREIDVTFAGRTEHGYAEDVDAEGSLILRRPDGSLLTLPAGEVTLRLPDR
jgi:BirA family biotin operon repressor/biotin-[acetyl-CoA-carboxylase] ligase